MRKLVPSNQHFRQQKANYQTLVSIIPNLDKIEDLTEIQSIIGNGVLKIRCLGQESDLFRISISQYIRNKNEPHAGPHMEILVNHGSKRIVAQSLKSTLFDLKITNNAVGKGLDEYLASWLRFLLD